MLLVSRTALTQASFSGASDAAGTKLQCTDAFANGAIAWFSCSPALSALLKNAGVASFSGACVVAARMPSNSSGPGSLGIARSPGRMRLGEPTMGKDPNIDEEVPGAYGTKLH